VTARTPSSSSLRSALRSPSTGSLDGGPRTPLLRVRFDASLNSVHIVTRDAAEDHGPEELQSNVNNHIPRENEGLVWWERGWDHAEAAAGHLHAAAAAAVLRRVPARLGGLVRGVMAGAHGWTVRALRRLRGSRRLRRGAHASDILVRWAAVQTVWGRRLAALADAARHAWQDAPDAVEKANEDDEDDEDDDTGSDCDWDDDWAALVSGVALDDRGSPPASPADALPLSRSPSPPRPSPAVHVPRCLRGLLVCRALARAPDVLPNALRPWTQPAATGALTLLACALQLLLLCLWLLHPLWPTRRAPVRP
jgi:hypothetical protein